MNAKPKAGPTGLNLAQYDEAYAAVGAKPQKPAKRARTPKHSATAGTAPALTEDKPAATPPAPAPVEPPAAPEGAATAPAPPPVRVTLADAGAAAEQAAEQAPDDPPVARPDIAEDFLCDLFGDDVSPGWLLTWHLKKAEGSKKEEKTSRWHQSTAAAAELAGKAPVPWHTYFGMGLRPKNLGAFERGGSNDVVAIPSLWLDVDYGTVGHEKGDLPQSAEDARKLIEEVSAELGKLLGQSMPAQPTCLVSSGGGFYPLWIFRATWQLGTPEERAKAAAISVGLQALFIDVSKRHNWGADSTGDLARVLRLPGSLNPKHNPPRLVTVETLDGRVYKPEEFDPLASYTSTSKPKPRRSTVDPGPQSNRPGEELEAILTAAVANDPVVAATWQQKRTDLKDTSQSGYDLALANQLVLLGLSDSEIRRILIQYRLDHGKDRRQATRTAYLLRTIARAREAMGPKLAELQAIEAARAVLQAAGAAAKDGKVEEVLTDAVYNAVALLLDKDPGAVVLFKAAVAKLGVWADVKRMGKAAGAKAKAERKAERQAEAEEQEAAQNGGTQIMKIDGSRKDLMLIAHDAEHAISIHRPQDPALYVRAGVLSRIGRGAKPPKWLKRENGTTTPTIVPSDLAHLTALSSHTANWGCWKTDKSGNATWEKDYPNSMAIKALLTQGTWKLPHLEAVIEAPLLRPDGSVLQTPGYDRDTGLYFENSGPAFPAVPESPTLDDAKRAAAELAELFEDFPFVESCDLAAAIAAILTLLGRYAIDGSVPMFGISATTPGTGKSLIADAVAILATGRLAPRISESGDENEDRKRLFSVAIAGDALVLFDNVAHPLGSPTLDACITSMTVRDRLLGLNKMASAPWNAVVLATGNNLQVKGDLARRVVPIQMVSKCERPEERTDIRHPRLIDWVRQERRRLVVAALTVLRAYHVAGRPRPNVPQYGSFEAWSDLIRGACCWAGLGDPAAGRARIREAADPEIAALEELLNAWHVMFGSKPQALPKVLQRLEAERYADVTSDSQAALRSALEHFDSKYTGYALNARRIGNALRKYRGRIVGGKSLEHGGKGEFGATWFVAVHTPPAAPPGGSGPHAQDGSADSQDSSDSRPRPAGDRDGFFSDETREQQQGEKNYSDTDVGGQDGESEESAESGYEPDPDLCDGEPAEVWS